MPAFIRTARGSLLGNFLVVLATCLATGVSGAQNLITDGSFENGAVPNCSQGNVPDTWYPVLVTPDVYSTDCASAPGLSLGSFLNFTTLVAAHDGFRFVAGTDTLSIDETFGQTLAAPLVSGATYRLRGAFARSDSRPDPGVYDIYLSPTTDVLDPGATLVASIGGNAVVGSWTIDEAVFVAPGNAAIATNILMVVRSLSVSPNSYIGSDSWSLEFVPPTPLLGPLGWTAVVVGGCGVASAALRRKVRT